MAIASYYNALVYFTNGKVGKFRKITNVKSFVTWAQRAGTNKIYFYRLSGHESKKGEYCGFWTDKNGLNIH